MRPSGGCAAAVHSSSSRLRVRARAGNTVEPPRNRSGTAPLPPHAAVRRGLRRRGHAPRRHGGGTRVDIRHRARASAVSDRRRASACHARRARGGEARVQAGAQELHPDHSSDPDAAAQFQQLVDAFKKIGGRAACKPGSLESHPMWSHMSELDTYWAHELGYGSAAALEEWLQALNWYEENEMEPLTAGAVAEEAPAELELDAAAQRRLADRRGARVPRPPRQRAVARPLGRWRRGVVGGPERARHRRAARLRVEAPRRRRRRRVAVSRARHGLSALFTRARSFTATRLRTAVGDAQHPARCCRSPRRPPAPPPTQRRALRRRRNSLTTPRTTTPRSTRRRAQQVPQRCACDSDIAVATDAAKLRRGDAGHCSPTCAWRGRRGSARRSTRRPSRGRRARRQRSIASTFVRYLERVRGVDGHEERGWPHVFGRSSFHASRSRTISTATASTSCSLSPSTPRWWCCGRRACRWAAPRSSCRSSR